MTIPATTPGRYGDGRGGHSLSLLVKSTTTGQISRTWAQRLRIDGKPVNLGLGSFPVVTLAEARAKARANARGVAQGTDPRAAVTTIPTFRDAVHKVIALHRATWKDGGNRRPNGRPAWTPTPCHGWATSRSTGSRLRTLSRR